MTTKPIILLSNDDGIEARGLRSLAEFLGDFGDIYVVAPMSPQSGKSSAITVDAPLRVREITDYPAVKAFSVSGTPVDCTKLAMHSLLPRRPDFIVSGINHGPNTGINTIYSGTMGVAFEGCINGIPSVGFSFLSHQLNIDFAPCRETVRHIMKEVIENGLPFGICLNVNIPFITEVKGIKVTKAAMGHWTDEYKKDFDPHGHPIYWLVGGYEPYKSSDDITTDLEAIAQGYAAVVPCNPDQTAFNALSTASSRFSTEF